MITTRYTPGVNSPLAHGVGSSHTFAGRDSFPIHGSTALLDDLFVECYYAVEAANEYTTEQIERKGLMLPGVHVPVAARWSGELLRDTGFGHAERFWRRCNIAGWIRIRD